MSDKSKVILIAGYNATGKSTFSKELARQLDIPCFNKDRIKEVIGEPIGSDDRAANLRLSMAAFGLMLYIAERMLKTGNIFILESNFKPHETVRLGELLGLHDYKILTYMFTGDLRVLYNRYVERDRTETRHWIHKFAVTNYNVFSCGNLELGKFDIGDEIIHVDATCFEKVNYNKLVKKAEQFINK